MVHIYRDETWLMPMWRSVMALLRIDFCLCPCDNRNGSFQLFWGSEPSDASLMPPSEAAKLWGESDAIKTNFDRVSESGGCGKCQKRHGHDSAPNLIQSDCPRNSSASPACGCP